MPGMDCWNSSYENSQGRESMEAELKGLKAEFPGVQDKYNDLNLENVEKATLQAKKDLKANKSRSTKLKNLIADETANLAKL